MRKFVDAAIPMQQNFEEVEFLFPRNFNFGGFINLAPLEPFSTETIDFISELSKVLYKDQRINLYPDVATFAFFCRRANLIQLKKNYSHDRVLRLGRGIVFHIVPSNVPVNFAYSLVCGLLAGNVNIVRLPSKFFEQVDIICQSIQNLSMEQPYQAIASRIVLMRYERQSNATSLFSSICDVRIIWGGDTTIEQIRNSKIPARSFDITFADRYSICAINADKYLGEPAPERVAMNFFNDTYLFDQNACTAPHLVLWLGTIENVETAKRLFWDRLHEIAISKYKVQPVIAVDKLTAFYNQAAILHSIKKIDSPDNLIWRITLNDLSKDLDLYRCTSGYFLEYHASSLFELSKIIDRKYQTFSYYGIEKEELRQFILNIKPFGIDRIVPIGKTMDFSLTWDGFNLIEALSRIIDIQ